jgi:hypothetical protein
MADEESPSAGVGGGVGEDGLCARVMRMWMLMAQAQEDGHGEGEGALPPINLNELCETSVSVPLVGEAVFEVFCKSPQSDVFNKSAMFEPRVLHALETPHALFLVEVIVRRFFWVVGTRHMHPEGMSERRVPEGTALLQALDILLQTPSVADRAWHLLRPLCEVQRHSVADQTWHMLRPFSEVPSSVFAPVEGFCSQFRKCIGWLYSNDHPVRVHHMSPHILLSPSTNVEKKALSQKKTVKLSACEGKGTTRGAVFDWCLIGV